MTSPASAAPAPFVIEEYVRWSDVDFAGIIFYGSYVRLFEIAETEMFRHCGLAYARMFDEYDISYLAKRCTANSTGPPVWTTGSGSPRTSGRSAPSR